MNTNISKILKLRRSHRVLKKDSKITNDEIINLVRDAVMYVPSAFDSQSGSTVILFGQEHDALWEITKSVLEDIVPADQFANTEKKIDTFKAAYGTILFFEDYEIINDLEEKFPLYKENFANWSEQGTGMLTLAVWLNLTEAGLGASLQHYNPLIDDEVKKRFNLPTKWRLRGQMPFGSYEQVENPKNFKNIDNRIRIFK